MTKKKKAEEHVADLEEGGPEQEHRLEGEGEDEEPEEIIVVELSKEIIKR